jgi:hypothetical protein
VITSYNWEVNSGRNKSSQFPTGDYHSGGVATVIFDGKLVITENTSSLGHKRTVFTTLKVVNTIFPSSLEHSIYYLKVQN